MLLSKNVIIQRRRWPPQQLLAACSRCGDESVIRAAGVDPQASGETANADERERAVSPCAPSMPQSARDAASAGAGSPAAGSLCFPFPSLSARPALPRSTILREESCRWLSSAHGFFSAASLSKMFSTFALFSPRRAAARLVACTDMLTEEQRARIERNREVARARLQARSQGAFVAPGPIEPVAPSVQETQAKPAPEEAAPRESALKLAVAELAAASRSGPHDALQCYARLEEAMQEDGAAEAFKACIANRLDCIIVSMKKTFCRKGWMPFICVVLPSFNVFLCACRSPAWHTCSRNTRSALLLPSN